MAKRTDEELREYHLLKAKQAENRIKQRERKMKEQQRKKENSIKFTFGGVLFKFFGDDVKDLSRREIEAYASGIRELLESNEKNVDIFRNKARAKLTEYQNKKEQL